MPKAKNVTVIPATRNLHTGTPMDAKRRRKVAGYARVSTDSDEQFTSYEAQVDYYTHTEDEYRRRYNDLTDRFRTEEEKHKRLTERRKRMVAESIAIGGMLSELTELEAPPIEFDEKLWHAVVERVTVYNDDRLVYSLKDGTEITLML